MVKDMGSGMTAPGPSASTRSPSASGSRVRATRSSERVLRACSANYWRYHYGAVMADYQYYM